MKKAINFIKKIKKIEFFYKKVLTRKKESDNITVVKKTEQEKRCKDGYKQCKNGFFKN